MPAWTGSGWPDAGGQVEACASGQGKPTVGRPTLADVARAAGVSPATASRALAGSDIVRPETRDQVTAAARKVGYRRIRAGRPCKATVLVGYVAIGAGMPVRSTTGAILVLPDLAMMREIAAQAGSRDGVACGVYELRRVAPPPKGPRLVGDGSGSTGRPMGQENPPAARMAGARGIQGAA